VKKYRKEGKEKGLEIKEVQKTVQPEAGGEKALPEEKVRGARSPSIA